MNINFCLLINVQNQLKLNTMQGNLGLCVLAGRVFKLPEKFKECWLLNIKTILSLGQTFSYNFDKAIFTRIASVCYVNRFNGIFNSQTSLLIVHLNHKNSTAVSIKLQSRLQTITLTLWCKYSIVPSSFQKDNLKIYILNSP